MSFEVEISYLRKHMKLCKVKCTIEQSGISLISTGSINKTMYCQAG